METNNKKIYSTPTVAIIKTDNSCLLSDSKPDYGDPWGSGRAKGTSSFDDFSDDDEDGLFYKKYTVKW